MDICVPLDEFAVGNKEGKVYVHSVTTSCCEPIDEASLQPSTSLDLTPDDSDTLPSIQQSVPARKFARSVGGRTSAGKTKLQHKRQASVPIVLQHPKCCSAVRQTSFSYDAKYLIYSCDDGSLLLWSIKTTKV